MYIIIISNNVYSNKCAIFLIFFSFKYNLNQEYQHYQRYSSKKNVFNFYHGLKKIDEITCYETFIF